ncbi:MAG: flavodoxin family protein [Candidatus Omnitrophica bacterium]|nr:flavodoxin family protein [Candidatus Omnitrophota bacterium]
MAQILVIYYTQTGNTEKMAKAICEGIEKEKVQFQLKKIQDTKPDDLLKADGILIGSPTYYGSMAFQIKELLDKSVTFHGSLDGKIGGAFASSANIGGGNETTILDILNAMLIHGMIIQGDPSGDHYGPVAIGSPDARASRQCARFGQRFAKLVKKVK